MNLPQQLKLIWLLYLLHGPADAQHSPLPPFKAICTDEVVSGLHADGDKWVATRFRADRKFLVTKLPSRSRLELEALPLSCRHQLDRLLREEKWMQPSTGRALGCYRIQEAGTNSDYAQVCEEWDIQGALSDWSSGSVQCNGYFNFHPKRGFLRVHLHADVVPAKGNDSVSVAAGSCALVE